jgi:hypothetical protein
LRIRLLFNDEKNIWLMKKGIHILRMKKWLIATIVFVCTIGIKNVAAQQFPVQVTPQLISPYTLQVSEYHSPAGGNNKLNLLLLNRDFNKPTLNVRLRMSIESQTVSLHTKEINTVVPFTIQAGVPYYVNPTELSSYFDVNNLDFSGITAQQYVQTGQLPEGFYTFCFEVIEVSTGQVVSNKGCTFAWINLNEPPFLNLPQKGERVAPLTPQNVVFNWTPRHTASPATAGFIEYVFKLVQLTDTTIAPEAAFFTGMPIDSSIENQTTIVYGTGRPLLLEGKTYAWRVQARSQAAAPEVVQFRNNGYSEIFWFTYKNTCPVVSGETAEVQGGYRALIHWLGNASQHLEYKVIYRKKNEPDAEWFNFRQTQDSVSIGDLQPLTTYEYRVGAACEYEVFVFGPTRQFTTDSSHKTTVPNCGVDPNLINPDSSSFLPHLNQGDTIRTGDFKTIVTKVDNPNGGGTGHFTGEGYVPVSYLGNMKIAVVFNNIKVDSTKKLVSGQIETIYDPTEGGIIDVDAIIDIFASGYGVGGVVTGEVTADTTFGFPIGTIGVTLPPGYDSTTGHGNGPITITVTPATPPGGPAVSYTVTQLPTTLMGSNGNIYQVGANGQVTLIAQGGGKELLKTLNRKLIDDDKALVEFEDYPEKQKYAFDKWRVEYKQSNTFNKEYEKIKTAKNIDYYVSAKAIAPAATDYIKARITITDNSIIKDSVKFLNGKGTIYTSTILPDSVTYEIAIVGGPEKDAQEIYAVYKPAGSKTLNLGKLLVASYPRREFNLTIVPVNSDIANLQNFKDSINLIYNQVNIYFSIKKDDPFPDTLWDINRNNKLDSDGDLFLSKYSSEMTALKNSYIRQRKPQGNEIFLFILNEADNITLNGEMPRSKRFGFLFTAGSANKSIISAHELGHGLFNLRHTFDNYGYSQNELPQNLMDYSLGTNLFKFQWDLVHDPALALGLFDSDDDAKSYGVAKLPDDFINYDGITFTFITYGGQSINVPKEATDFIFHFGIATYEGSHKQVTGVLQEFKYNNIVYTVDFSGGISYKGNNGTVYQNLILPQGEKSIIMGLPNEESLTLYKFNTASIARYDPANKVFTQEEKLFTFKPFSPANFILKNNTQAPIKYNLPKQGGTDTWIYDDVIYKKVKGFAEKPEILYIK